jgi:hypothetical protein
MQNLWMVEVKWSGKVVRCHRIRSWVPPKLKHNDEIVYGIVEAKTKEEAFDAVTEYMEEHGW